VNPVNGKGLHWVTDVTAEIPIKLRASGFGSEKPQTITSLFVNQVKASGPRNAIFIERGGKILTWTWD
jgi:long-chain-fatty-acid--CoA ligase ACSBG